MAINSGPTLSRISAGDLRHVVTLQTKQITRSKEGGFQPLAWVNTVTGIRASITPKTGNENMFSDAVRAQMSHTIVCRAQSAEIVPDQRLYWAGLYSAKSFNIVAVQTMDMIKNMVILAVEELVGSSASASGAASVPVNYGIFETPEIDFMATHDLSFDAPSGKRFYVDSMEIVVTQFRGTLILPPFVRLGIAGNLTKYVSRLGLASQLNAQNKRQNITTLSANEGETGIHIGISVAGSVTGGVPTSLYKGVLSAVGKMIG